jgi:hypothetical protein
MCFKKPKAPKPTAADKAAEADAAAQRKLALDEQYAIRTDNKEQRKNLRLGMLGMRFGRSSLLTGSRGGMGYAAPMARSLLSVAG